MHDRASGSHAATVHEPAGYRSDIDGLRAIAVGIVILFHAFPTLLPGGFVGVDVFFVISGFVITQVLLREQERTGRISFADFYARRARRLLPALLLMLTATLVAAWITVPADGEFQAVAQSELWTLGFLSNLFFARQPSGYFAGPSESYPLLHTWTLAVEEQFYLLWPLLVVAGGAIASRIRLSRKTMLGITVAAVFVVSLALSILVTMRVPQWAFYLPFFRAWEFAIGAALALWRPRVPSILALIGIAAILAAALSFNSRMAFPGWIALLPTLGAALVVAGGGQGVAGRALSLRPVVYVGKISYGLYLWHWPVLALARMEAMGPLTTGTTIAAIAIAFVLSVASYHLVEIPIREQQVVRGSWPSIGFGLAIMLGGAMLASLLWLQGNSRLAASPLLRAIDTARTAETQLGAKGCAHYQLDLTELAPVEGCMLGDRGASHLVILWGDSHVAVLPRARGGCRPMPGRDALIGVGNFPRDIDRCEWFRRAVLTQVRALAARRPVTLLVVGRWPDRAAPETLSGNDKDPGGRVAGATRSIQAQLPGLPVAVMLDTPRMLNRVPECLGRRPQAACDAPPPTVRDADPAIRSVAGISVIDPLRAMCDAHGCRSFADGAVLYKDDQHLSKPGSLWLGAKLRDQLNRALLPAR